MCRDCGCEEANHHHFSKAKATSIHFNVEEKILQKNDSLAHENYHWLDDRNILAINFMSSPGSGKTEFLKHTIVHLAPRYKITIFVGDQETDLDAQRLNGHGAYVQQISTHSSCHLDASMIQKQIHDEKILDPQTDFLFIENVGNLVCPAAFELGEKVKIALLSTTEGEDKPLKYPVLFHEADCVIITKSDLLPHLEWDENLCLKNIKKVNPHAQVFKVSSKSHEGFEQWYQYLENMHVSSSSSKNKGNLSSSHGPSRNGRPEKENIHRTHS